MKDNPGIDAGIVRDLDLIGSGKIRRARGALKYFVDSADRSVVLIVFDFPLIDIPELQLMIRMQEVIEEVTAGWFDLIAAWVETGLRGRVRRSGASRIVGRLVRHSRRQLAHSNLRERIGARATRRARISLKRSIGNLREIVAPGADQNIAEE